METGAERVAVVTGGAQGIGRAFALRFAADGLRVVVADVNIGRAQAVRDEIVAQGAQALAVRVDVAEPADSGRMAEAALQRFGRIDVLAHCAAKFLDLERKAFWEIDVDEWDRVMAVNVRGTWLAITAVIPAMRAQGAGSIIAMSSNTFVAGRPGFLHYVASKGAVVGIVRAASRELGPLGIRINCLMPGSTLTEARPAFEDPRRGDELLAQQAIKRHERPQDLVGMASFLASDDASFITGQSLIIDGGYALG